MNTLELRAPNSKSFPNLKTSFQDKIYKIEPQS